MTVDELQVLITANAEQLRRELASSKKEIADLGKNVAGISSSIPKSFARVGMAASAMGNIIANVVTSAVRALTSQFGDAIKRLDTLNNYPKVMSNLGIGAEESRASIQRLNDKLLGLPTTIDSAAMAVQRFTSANGNIGASTEMFLALNNAILAGGAGMDIQSSAIEQLSQSYAKGKPDMMEWRTAMMAMPAQLKQVALAMGYVNSDQLGAALRDGEVSMNDFMKKLVELNKTGENGFQSLEAQARNATGGVGTGIINVKTAITRALADIMGAIGQTNISGFFQGIASAINAVVPYVVAFVKVIVMAVSWVSALFGGGKKQADTMAAASNNAASAVGSVGAGAAAASDSLGGAAGNAKKLKKELAGLASFDEMNVLKEPEAASDGGSGGAGGGGGDLSGMAFDPSEITGSLDKITPKVEAIMGFFKSMGDVFRAIWNTEPVQAFVGYIGAAAGFVGQFFYQMGQAAWTNIVGTWQQIAPNVSLILTNLSILWTLFWTDLTVAIETWGQPIIDSSVGLFNAIWTDAISPFIVLVTQMWADFTGVLLTTWQKYGADIANKIGEFVNNVIQLFKSIWDNVIAPIIKPFLEMLADLWENNLKGTVTQIMDFVGKLVVAALDIYNKFIAPIAKFLLEILKPAFTMIGTVVAGVFGTIIGTISTVVGSIFGILGGLIDFLTGVFTGNWSKAWDGVKSIFSNIVNGLGAIFKAPLNLIIDLINGMIAGINSIKIPDWVPGIGGKNLNIPKIPKLARGGIIDRATLAVVGESGREAVMPLENNTGWIDQLAAMLAARGGSGGGAPIQLTVKIGEETLLTRVIDGINDKQYQNNGGVITI